MSEIRRGLRLAEQDLGAPARAVSLTWNIEQMLLRVARREGRRGLDGGAAHLEFSSGRPGHELKFGLERFRVNTPDGPLRVVRVIAPQATYDPDACYEFWAVARADYLPLYRFLRAELRREQRAEPPIMRSEDQARLWDNSVGFLRRGSEVLRRYGVPQKRGILLLGEPGNGKTMACRWLRWECERRGLEWRSVSAEEYDEERRGGNAHQLFELCRPGMVFFDDVDMALRDRGADDPTPDRSTFLGALDGLSRHQGVVYVFTSNAKASQIDPAFRRPGRIDLVMSFPPPDAALRRQLIERTWHADLLANVAVDQIVAATDGLSFAEVEEVKKLLVLGYLHTNCWNWDGAWRLFRSGRGDSDASRRIGFITNGHTPSGWTN
jgi:cell division protease FtsH